MANIIQCGKPYALCVLRNKCLVMITKQIQLYVVILRKCAMKHHCPPAILTSAQNIVSRLMLRKLKLTDQYCSISMNEIRTIVRQKLTVRNFV